MATPHSTTPTSQPRAENPELLFKPFPRVLYQHNPLEFVICELRFPPILKLDLEVPASFQEMVRTDFPLYREINPINLSSTSPAEVLKLLGVQSSPIPLVKTYEFSSADSIWNVSLTRGAMSLTCGQYKRWEEFRAQFEKPFKALIENYDVQFFLRIGLRYRDVISREKLGLQDVAWGELLDPWVAAEFHSSLASVVVGSWHNVVFKLSSEDVQIQLQHGLQPAADGGSANYVIDTDFSTSARKETANVFDVLQSCNKYSWRVFRSCICERLHNAMDPRPI